MPKFEYEITRFSPGGEGINKQGGVFSGYEKDALLHAWASDCGLSLAPGQSYNISLVRVEEPAACCKLCNTASSEPECSVCKPKADFVRKVVGASE